jgi:hypothetical protein
VVTELTQVADAWELTVPAEGTGARIRDVLSGLFGPDAAAGLHGWATARVATQFAAEPPPAARPAAPRTSP